MDELIDKWNVVGKLITLQNNYTFFKNEWDAERLCREIAKLEIEVAKTPGLKLVRCNKCTYWDKAKSNKKGFLICPASGMEITADDFCSYGERKDNETV